MGFFRDMGDLVGITSEAFQNASEKDEFMAGTIGFLTGAASGAVASGGNPMAAFGSGLVGAGSGVAMSKEAQAQKQEERDAQNVLNSLVAEQNSLIDPRSFQVQSQATQPTLIG